MRRKSLVLALALSFGAALSIRIDAQSTKPVPGFADYGKWESISLSGSVAGAGGGGGRFGGGGSGLTADGKFLGYTITKSNRDSELVGSSRVDLQACKLEYSIVSPK